MIASEAQPFSKTGGLADVATALPKALGRLGHDVTLITPRYRGVTDGPVVGTVSLEVAAHRFNGAADAKLPARPPASRRCCCSIARSSTIAPASITTRSGDFADNAVRYAFLSAAAIDWASQQSPPFDIVHAHDWQAGLAPVYAAALAVGTVRTAHGADGLHHPQPRVSGHLRQELGAAARSALGRLHGQRLRVLRSPELPEGRHQLRRCDHHGEPDLRRGDPAARVRLRVRRRDPQRGAMRWSASSTASITTNGIPRRIRILPAPFDAGQPRRASRPPSARCSRRSASRSPTICWRGRWSAWCRAWSIRRAST